VSQCSLVACSVLLLLSVVGVVVWKGGAGGGGVCARCWVPDLPVTVGWVWPVLDHLLHGCVGVVGVGVLFENCIVDASILLVFVLVFL